MISSDNQQLCLIKQQLSSARLSTYEKYTNNLDEAIQLYWWNIQISSALFECISICEVLIRNTISQALIELHGENWAMNKTFQASLVDKTRKSLQEAINGVQSTDQVIAKLSFFFWQQFFTKRFDHQLWQGRLAKYFPNLMMPTLPEARKAIFDDLEKIRWLRNRIAHHEPIFNKDIENSYQTIQQLIAYQSPSIACQMNDWQRVEVLLQSSPIQLIQPKETL